jgi:microcystin-dependent protein
MDGFVGFTILFAGNFAPNNWALCDGRLLKVAANPILFAVIGNAYGGDGIQTFALPDLRGRMVVGAGQGISNYKRGDSGGIESVLLNTKSTPAHTHPVQVTIKPRAALTANSSSPVNAVYATSSNQMFAPDHDKSMSSYTAEINTSAIGSVDPEPVAVLHPVLALNYIICIKESFPERNK